MKIIGITGQKRSGKDTIAKLLNKKYKYEIYHFADPIKSMLSTLLNYVDANDNSFFEDRKEENIDPLNASYRKLAQTLGTEWGRNLISDNIWVDVLAFNSQWEDAIVIPDVRFDNEAKWVKSQNGIIISVTRNNESNDSHASEQGIDKQYIDYAVTNDSDIAALYDSVIQIMNQIQSI